MLPIGLMGFGILMMLAGWMLGEAIAVIAAVFVFFLAAILFVALPLIVMARARK